MSKQARDEGIVVKFLLIALFALAASAQTPTRSVTLTWTDASNPVGTTYNIFKAPSPCATNPTNFARIATGVAVKNYLDAPVSIGSYCYYVTAVYAASESARSQQAPADVNPFAPTGVTATVSVTVNVTVAAPQPQPQAQQQDK